MIINVRRQARNNLMKLFGTHKWKALKKKNRRMKRDGIPHFVYDSEKKEFRANA